VIRVYEEAGNAIGAHDHKGDFKMGVTSVFPRTGCLFISNITD